MCLSIDTYIFDLKCCCSVWNSHRRNDNKDIFLTLIIFKFYICNIDLKHFIPNEIYNVQLYQAVHTTLNTNSKSKKFSVHCFDSFAFSLVLVHLHFVYVFQSLCDLCQFSYTAFLLFSNKIKHNSKRQY